MPRVSEFSDGAETEKYDYITRRSKT